MDTHQESLGHTLPRRHRVAVAYLGAYGFSSLGNSIITIALPILALQRLGSPTLAGLVAISAGAGSLLGGIFIGPIVDRINRRTCAIVSDSVSALAVVALPIVDTVWGLNFEWLLILAALGTIGDIPGLTAREALLPAIIAATNMPAHTMTGVREGVSATAMLIGPAAAGLMLSTLSSSTLLYITSATSLAAIIVTTLIPHQLGSVQLPTESANRSQWRHIHLGWKAIVQDPFLRTLTLITTTIMMVISALQALILPVHFSATGREEVTGFVLAAFAAGALVGGTAYALAGHFGRREWWMRTGLVLSAIAIAVIGILPPTVMLFSAATVLGIATGSLSGLVGVLMIERLPGQMRGRVFAAQNALQAIAPPLGIAGAILLIAVNDINRAGLAITGVWVVTVFFALFSPSLKTLKTTATESTIAPTKRADSL